ncbi:CvpA family protein [candidate division KSB1 bacterium]
MSGLDIILLLVMITIGLICLIKGIIKTVFFIISLVAASLCSMIFYKPVSGIIDNLINNNLVSTILAYIGIYIIVMILFNLLAKGFKAILKFAHLGWMDRAGGLIFGCLIGVFLNSILIILLTILSPKKNNAIEESIFAPYMLKIAKTTISILPPNLKDTFNEKVKEIAVDRIKNAF